MKDLEHILSVILLPIDPNADEAKRGAIYFFRAFLFFAIFSFSEVALRAIGSLL